MKKALGILLLIFSIIPLFSQGVLIDKRGLIYREENHKLYVAKSLPEGEEVRKLGWDGDERFFILTKKLFNRFQDQWMIFDNYYASHTHRSSPPQT